MYGDIVIGMFASVRGRCTTHQVNDANSAEFSFRIGEQTLDLEFDAQSLEAFLLVALVAYQQMKELQAQPPC